MWLLLFYILLLYLALVFRVLAGRHSSNSVLHSVADSVSDSTAPIPMRR